MERDGPRARAPARAPGRSAGHRTEGRRPAHRVLAVAAHRLGCGGDHRRGGGEDGPGGPIPATGPRRPEVVELERLVVIWCPELQQEGPRGEEARRFVQVVDRPGELCPWTHPIRLGVCALPARGPARFFGGEEMVVSRLVEAVGENAHVGVADGLFAAVLAARARLIVPGRGGAPLPGALVGGHLGPPRLGGHLAAARRHHVGPVRRPAVPARLGPLRRRRRRGPPGGPGRERGVDRGSATGPSSGGCGSPGVRIPTWDPYRPLTNLVSSVAHRPQTPAPPSPSPGYRTGWVSRPYCSGHVQGGRDPAEQATLVPWGTRRPGRPRRVVRPGRGRLPVPFPDRRCSGCPGGSRWSTPTGGR